MTPNAAKLRLEETNLRTLKNKTSQTYIVANFRL